MAERLGNLEFSPSIDSVIEDWINDSIKSTIKRASKEAHDLVMSKWSQGIGYNSSGIEGAWVKNSRDNPTLMDTLTLKQSLNIKLLDGGYDFTFEVSGASDYFSGASVEEVSEYNSDRPHTNVPIEYLAEPDVGDETEKILMEEMEANLNAVVESGKIKRI